MTARPPLASGGISRRSLLSAFGLGTAGLALSACGNQALGDEAPPEGPPLVLGVCLELSGYFARIGRAELNAINIVANKINRSGFVASGRTRKIQLLPALDNLSDVKHAKIVFQQLIDQNVAAVIGGATSETSLAMGAIAEQHQVPMISLSSARSVTLPAANHQYVFRLGPNSADVAKLLADAIVAEGHKSVMIIPSNDAHGRDGAQALLATTAFTNSEIQVSVVKALPPPQPVVNGDVEATYQEVLAANPDAVIIWSVAPTAGVIARALHDPNHTVVRSKLFFDAGAASAETLSAQNTQAMKQSVAVTTSIIGGPPAAVTTPAAAARADFFNTYTSVYERFDGLAPYGGDALKIIVNAVAQTGMTDRQSLREAIEQTISTRAWPGRTRSAPGGTAAWAATR